MNPLWLEYRLDALTLEGGRKLHFPTSTRLLYNPADHVIAIETTGPKRKQILERPDLLGAELRRIEYAMLVNLPPHPRMVMRFYHPMNPGNGVRLAKNDRGQLFFRQQNGAPLFSKDYTLRDVSRGAIDSDRAVWQFHGWKHEH